MHAYNFSPLHDLSKKKEPENEKHGPKRRKRRDQIQEGKQVSRFQVCCSLHKLNNLNKHFLVSFPCLITTLISQQKFVATMKRLLLFIIIVAALIAVTYYSYKGLLQLSDWMNEVELQRAKRRRSRF